MNDRVVNRNINRRPWLAVAATLVVVCVLLGTIFAMVPTFAESDLPRKALERLGGGPTRTHTDQSQQAALDASVDGEPEFPRPDEPERPLAVRSDAALLKLARNHGHSASGTRDDPVVLEGDLLSETNLTTLIVENTSLHLVIRGLRLDGATSGVGVILEGADNVTLDGLHVKQYHTAVEAVGAKGLKIENSRFMENSRTILLVDVDDVEIRSNRFLDNGHAVFVRNDDPDGPGRGAARGLVFADNVVKRDPRSTRDTDRIAHQASALVLAGTGLEIVGNNFTGHSPSVARINATDVHIEGNGFFEGKENALILSRTVNTTVVDNHFAYNVESAIFAVDTVGTRVEHNVFNRNPNGAYKGVGDRDLEIRDNTFTWNHAAVTLWSPEDPVFAHNRVRGGESGLRVMNGEGVSVLENRFEGTWESSVVFFSTQDALVTNNEMVGGKSSGLYVTGAKEIRFEKNTIRDHDHGVVITGGSSQVEVLDNEFTDGGRVGIRVLESQGVLLEANRVSDLDFGVIAENRSKELTIRDGVFTRNHAGILVIHGAGPVVIKNNRVEENRYGVILEDTQNHRLDSLQVSGNQRGLFLRGTTGNQITDSYVEGNEIGIYLVRSTENRVYNNIFGNEYTNAYLIKSPGNEWNTKKIAGPNIVGGPWIAGNWWHDYVGVDANLDGLGNVPHQPIPYHPSLEMPANELGLPMGPFDLHPLVKDGGPPV